MNTTLINGGYRIDGENFKIVQDFDPAKPFLGGVPQPFDSADAAAAHAAAVIAEQAALLTEVVA